MASQVEDPRMRRGLALPIKVVVRTVVVAALAAITVAYLSPATAYGCSCAWPPDIQRNLEESRAAFVGTLVDVTGGIQGRFGGEAVFKFQVETWVKGGPGEFVEVHSPIGDGGNCGLSNTIGMHTAMFAYEWEGRLSSSSCSTLSPEMLLDFVDDTRASETNIPWLLLGGSQLFRVVDDTGALITRLDPRSTLDESGYVGRSTMSVCPGGSTFVHFTSDTITAWDIESLEAVRRTEIVDLGEASPIGISCRNEDASVVWLIVNTGMGSYVLEAVGSGETLYSFDDEVNWIGETHLITHSYERAAVVRVDLATLKSTLLYQGEAGLNTDSYLDVVPNPFNDTTAVFHIPFQSWEGRFPTLYIYDGTGSVLLELPLSGEFSTSQWAGPDSLLVLEYASDSPRPLSIDVSTGETTTIPAWSGWEFLVDNGKLYGVDGYSVITIDIESGETGNVVTLDFPSAAPLMVLPGSREVTPNQPVITAPPLTPEELTSSAGAAVTPARVIFLVLVVFAVAGAGASFVRSRRTSTSI